MYRRIILCYTQVCETTQDYTYVRIVTTYLSVEYLLVAALYDSYYASLSVYIHTTTRYNSLFLALDDYPPGVDSKVAPPNGIPSQCFRVENVFKNETKWVSYIIVNTEYVCYISTSTWLFGSTSM